MVDVKKNTQYLIPRVNTSYLAEETTYDLYLWLNDADNGKSSAVKKLTVTTLDKTPPVIQHLTVTDVAARSVTLTYSLDEPGTLYWAVVKRGTQFYAQGIDDPEELDTRFSKFSAADEDDDPSVGNLTAELLDGADALLSLLGSQNPGQGEGAKAAPAVSDKNAQAQKAANGSRRRASGSRPIHPLLSV